MTGPASKRSTPGLVTGLAIGLSVLLILALNVVPTANNDVWILMKVGELIMQTGKIPETVLFAFTTVRDNHFNAHEWLASVIFHEFDHLWGLDSLMWIMGVFALAQFALCVVLARRQCGSLGTALLLAMLAMICANYRYVMRPELFALLFLVCLLLVLERYRSGGRWTTLLWTIPIAIGWANCHGSFLLAPGIVGLFAFGEGWTAARAASGSPSLRVRAGMRVALPYAITVLAMTAACALNPAGWSLLAFPFQLQRAGLVRMVIKEWLPTFSPLFVVEPPFWVFCIIALAVASLVGVLRRHLRATDVLLLVFFTALALERSRHLVWFGFVAMTVCARLLGQVTPERRSEMRLRVASAGFALVGFCLCLVFGNVTRSKIYFAPSNNFGSSIVHELADPTMAGNVLNSYELGGELIYRDWPRLKPSIDSRVDSYGEDYLALHIRMFQDEKLLNQFLDGNRVNYMLLLWRDFHASVHAMPSIAANWHIRLTTGDIYVLERNQHLPLEPESSAPAPATSNGTR